MITIKNCAHLNQIDIAFTNPGSLAKFGKILSKGKVGEIWELHQKAISLYLYEIVFNQ